MPELWLGLVARYLWCPSRQSDDATGMAGAQWSVVQAKPTLESPRDSAAQRPQMAG
jgi:hypothetical protein